MKWLPKFIQRSHQACWHIPTIQVLKRQKQEDCYKFIEPELCQEFQANRRCRDIYR